MAMIVLVVVLFGTDVTIRPMGSMTECLDAARLVAETADRGNVMKQANWWSVECKRLDYWMSG
ncbi:MAG: hypothetical protein ACR2QJ_16050 [Geminicoccaceae bacterium]